MRYETRLRYCAVLILVGALASVGPWPAIAQRGNEQLAALRAQVSRLYDQGKYGEALPVAERYVASASQRYGQNHIEYGVAINWLAHLYEHQGRYAEAKSLYKRVLVITEKKWGPDHK